MDVQQDLLAAVEDLAEGVMIEEEDTIVDMPLEADIAEDIEADLGDTLRTENKKERGEMVISITILQRIGKTRSIRKVTGPDAENYVSFSRTRSRD